MLIYVIHSPTMQLSLPCYGVPSARRRFILIDVIHKTEGTHFPALIVKKQENNDIALCCN